MNRPVPSAKQLEEAAFTCAVLLVALLIAALLDGYDGVVSTKSGTHRYWDDPTGFRGAMMIRWGFPAILAALGAICIGIGALVAKGSERASTTP